jgi:hypothetical protein
MLSSNSGGGEGQERIRIENVYTAILSPPVDSR